MRLELHSRGWRFLSSIIILFTASLLGWMMARPWVAEFKLGKIPTRDGLLKAISYDPYNPRYHYLLDLYSLYDSNEIDHKMALSSITTAVALSPVTPKYWLELSRVYSSLGMGDKARDALDRTILLNPKDLKTRWWAVNLSLRIDDKGDALRWLKGIARDYPIERRRVFTLLHIITGDNLPLILEEGIPEEAGPMTAYLSFLMERGDKGAVKSLWAKLIKAFEVEDGIKRDYINYLISHGEIEEARREWDRYMGVEGEADLVWNGGFELEVANWGFGWRVGRVDGVETGIDDSLSYDGRRSLRIGFDGRHNVEFREVYQIVPLEPGREYTLGAMVRTEGLTTTNGIFMEFYGMSGCKFYRRVDPLTGTNHWRELKVEVTTPEGCSAGVVRFRRERSSKLDNLIAGRVWIDGVSLTGTSKDLRGFYEGL